MKTQDDPNAERRGRFAYDGLERVLHEKARLGIMTSLLCHPEGLLFAELKELCDLTDGNLSRHLQLLRESGLVEMWKGERMNRSVTLCRLTGEGEMRFRSYIDELEKVLQDAAKAAEKVVASAKMPAPAKDADWGSGELAPA